MTSDGLVRIFFFRKQEAAAGRRVWKDKRMETGGNEKIWFFSSP